MDLFEICKEALLEARNAALELENTVTDNRHNIQTSADLNAEKRIIDVLKKHGVSCTLHSEELDEPIKMGDGQYDIVVDPIDGSFFFLHGIKTFTSVAMSVLEKGKVKYSFVQSVADLDLYHCDENAAYLNGKQIVCDTNAPEPYLITGYAARREQGDIAGKLATLPSEYYFLNDGGPKLAAMVAANQIDAAMEFKPTRFNEFAGALIAQKAGAFVETIDGKPLVIDPLARQSLIVARSEKLLRELQQVLA
ncbi:MAG: inositol monophosphatase family protein [Minisyncoccia bacterium]